MYSSLAALVHRSVLAEKIVPLSMPASQHVYRVVVSPGQKNVSLMEADIVGLVFITNA